MPLVNPYVNLVEFKGWVRLDDNIDDTTIERVISAVSRGIDNYCQRHFWQTAAATSRVFDSCEYWRLEFGPFNDLVSATAVATDENGDGTFETVWAASDYQLLPLRPAAAPELEPFTSIEAITGGRRFPPYIWPGRRGRVQITGTWGWPAIPDGVVQACLLVCNRVLKRRGSPEGVAGFGDFGAIRITRADDPDAVSYLDEYWHPAGVGV